MLYVKEVTELESEFGRENCFTVTDDKVWEAMVSHNHVNHHFRQSYNINDDFDRLFMPYLGQIVDNN